MCDDDSTPKPLVSPFFPVSQESCHHCVAQHVNVGPGKQLVGGDVSKTSGP